MSQQFTTPMSNGGSMPSSQPVKNSVAGSPFTVGATSIPTPNLKASGVLVSITGEPIHLRINDEGDSVAADANDIVYPVGLYHIPIKSGQTLNMLQTNSGAVVYVEYVKENL